MKLVIIWRSMRSLGFQSSDIKKGVSIFSVHLEIFKFYGVDYVLFLYFSPTHYQVRIGIGY